MVDYTIIKLNIKEPICKFSFLEKLYGNNEINEFDAVTVWRAKELRCILSIVKLLLMTLKGFDEVIINEI